MCSKRAKGGTKSGTDIACLADSSRRNAIDTEAPSRRQTDALWPGRVKVNQSKSKLLIRPYRADLALSKTHPALRPLQINNLQPNPAKSNWKNLCNHPRRPRRPNSGLLRVNPGYSGYFYEKIKPWLRNMKKRFATWPLRAFALNRPEIRSNST